MSYTVSSPMIGNDVVYCRSCGFEYDRFKYDYCPHCVEMAEYIYDNISGCDNVVERGELIQEIVEWLIEGDPYDPFDKKKLVQMWNEYVQQG